MGYTLFTVDSLIRNGHRVWIVFIDGCSYGKYEYADQQDAWEKLHELRAQTTVRG